LHLITAPALSRRQTLPTQKKHEAPDVRAAPGAWSVGRGRRLMYLLGAGAVVSGGKRRSATLRNDPIRGRAVEREGDGGRRWRTVWLAGQGIALGIHGVGGAGREAQIAETAQRPYMRSCRRAPTRGMDRRRGWAAKGLPSAVTGSVGAGAGSANQRDRATTLYAALPPSADPRGGRTGWMSGQGVALDLHRVGGAGREVQIGESRNDPICGPTAERRPEGRTDGGDVRARGCPRPSPGRRCGRAAQIGKIAQRPYMRSCRRAPTRGADGADGRCGLSVKGLSSTFTEPAVPGGKRKSARARNDPICGPAAERRPEGREGGVDGRSRGCPRPSPGRWCRTASANRPDLATTLYAVLPTRADPVVGSAGRPRGCPGDGGGWPARGPAMTESWGRRHEEERPHDGEERRRRGGPGPPCPTTPHHE